MQDILDQIADVSRRLGRVLVGIDGRGGAGKSTLARQLVAALPDAAVIELDWFHLPQDRVTAEASYDFERFQAEVVVPFKSSSDALELGRYNWGYFAGKADGLEPDVFRIPRTDVLIVEGCLVLSAEIADCFDLRVWVDTEATEALRRGMRRDIDEYGLDPVKVAQSWLAWAEQEERCLAQEDRRLRADLCY